ncbi:DUF6152 family protein [Dongia soli]|uniref:DUF6152 family protein n=1 Tax=Dongia soli TaxID=600628 RepID=UPI0036237367
MKKATSAHHGWGGYDTSRPFTLTGQIETSSFQNPDCEIDMNANGKHWPFVLAPPSRMLNRGITPEMIASGKTCTVYGYPHQSNPEEARIEYIILDDKRYELR